MLAQLPLNVSVRDVMSSPVVTATPESSLYDCLVTMRTNGFAGLPVIGKTERVVGVVSERDVARVFAGSLSEHRVKALLDVLLVGLLDQPERSLRESRERLEQTRVDQAMSAPPYIIRPDAPLELAAEVMTENRINRIPVVSRGKLVGIVTRSDLVRGLMQRRH